MLKKTLPAMVAASLLIATAASSETSKFGLGIIIGEPTGIDGKFMLANEHAIEGAAAWSLSGNNEFHIQGDYLFHNYELINVESGQLPLFFGVGGRIVFLEKVDDVVGIRFPVGLSYIFDNAPFDIFGEVVPILDITPDTDFDFEGAIGTRFWF